MANNRMVMVCGKCKLGMAIAKYYPVIEGAGWYINNSNKAEVLNEFFIRHAHDYDQSMWGGNQYYLSYEMDDNTDWRYE